LTPPAELPQLDEARIGIVVKIALREHAQAHELNVMWREKGKIALGLSVRLNPLLARMATLTERI